RAPEANWRTHTARPSGHGYLKHVAGGGAAGVGHSPATDSVSRPAAPARSPGHRPPPGRPAPAAAAPWPPGAGSGGTGTSGSSAIARSSTPPSTRTGTP